MKRPENNKWLNGALEEVIGSEKPRTDFEQWKQKHPEAVEMLISRTSRASREVLGEIERRQTMSVKVRNWKYAAVIALICTGVVAAAVVGVKIYNYRVVSKDPERGYLLASEDGLKMINIHEADSPEQAVEYAEEIALLKQQGNRELVGVSEIEVNGQFDRRSLSYEYNLSDGQTLTVGERDPDDPGPRTLVGEQRKELRQLWHEQLDTENWQEFITTEEKQVYGSVFSFTKWKLVLSDGTEVVYSIGRLKDD